MGLVGKYIMKQCDVDLCHSLVLKLKLNLHAVNVNSQITETNRFQKLVVEHLPQGLFLLNEHLPPGLFLLSEHLPQGLFLLSEHLPQGLFLLSEHLPQGLFLLNEHLPQGLFLLNDYVLIDWQLLLMIC